MGQAAFHLRPKEVSGVRGRQFDARPPLQVIFEYPLKVHLLAGIVWRVQVGQITGNNCLALTVPVKGFLQELEGAVREEIIRPFAYLTIRAKITELSV
jgi:hypothetical protein